MSSASTASILPSPGPSASSIAGQRNLVQRPLAPSSSNLQPAPPKASSSHIAPALSSSSSSSSRPTLAASPPKVKPAPLVPSGITPSPASATTSVAMKKDNASGPLVQPSKEWVLPARAKPGRKPSETEPLTKRKAQNRASQRAFRERKQTYLADLEAKVAAYEAAEIDRSVEIQKAAQKLRAENEALRKEVAAWKDKFAQLERVLIQAKANGGRLPTGTASSSRAGPGCKAPAHERAAMPKRGVLMAPGAKAGSGKDKNAGGVRSADAVQGKIEPEVAEAVPLRCRPSSSSIPPAASPVTPSSPPKPAVSTASGSTAEEQTSLPSRKGVKPPLWSFETPKPTSNDKPALTTCSSSDKSSSVHSPSLLPDGGHLSVDGGCGFCTEASPCVCTDDFLDLSSQSQPSHIAVPEDVSSAVPLPKRNSADSAAKSSTSTAAETSRRMSIGSLTHASNQPVDQRRRGNTKLWYTVSQPESQPSSVPLSLRSSSKSGKKLWAVRPASTSPEPICTGDPSTCGACSSDPGLAAFCEAITTATTGPSAPLSSTLVPPAAQASAVRPGMLRSGTTGLLPSSSSYSSSSSSGETIPSAWKQIRSHSRFSQWQGGLDLLAEVVSKRSGNVHSPLLSHSKRPREESVEIETPRTTTTGAATSNDRAKPILAHSSSDSLVATTKVKIEQEDEERERESKRRRILIDKEAVKEALALLDAGTAAQPRGSVGLGISAKDEAGGGPCPCPWRPGEKRSP